MNLRITIGVIEGVIIFFMLFYISINLLDSINIIINIIISTFVSLIGSIFAFYSFYRYSKYIFLEYEKKGLIKNKDKLK